MLSTMERLGHAVNSSDLSHNPLRTTDVDLLAASGAAGIKNPHGSKILRMDLELSRSSFNDALPDIKQVVREQAKKNGWCSLMPKALSDIAMAAREHYMHPACPVCEGRGYIFAEHKVPSPCIGDKGCDATGKKKVKGRWQREIRAVLAAMEQLRENTLQSINRQLCRPAFA